MEASRRPKTTFQKSQYFNIVVRNVMTRSINFQQSEGCGDSNNQEDCRAFNQGLPGPPLDPLFSLRLEKDPGRLKKNPRGQKKYP